MRRQQCEDFQQMPDDKATPQEHHPEWLPGQSDDPEDDRQEKKENA